ncbi:MAG: TetR family transcriptional regulator [Frankiales bacterium]|nr:TetR family transcriptional regulator [Frankiales bacterium]
MTKPQRADAQRNRDKLLTVAVAAFSDLGVDVPLETIAAQAGVGVGTLYRHFPNRNALIEAAYRHEVERLCEAAPELLATHEPAEALREWMERFAQYAATKRGMGDALRSAIASDSPLFGHTRSQIVAALRVLLDAGTAEGSLRDDADPEDVMRAMGAVWNVASGLEWQDQVRRLLGLLVDGLRYRARKG